MRENGTVHGKMIDRNWVLKRKRKRLPSGSDLFNGKEGISQPLESPRNNSSAKRRLKGDFNMSQSARKKKGNDGYYFECVICDLGGNLLCCDSCPRTYHLQCLTPPLKRTPPGKWQCPNCSEQKESVKHFSHPETVSRRARTKIYIEKSKPGTKPSGSDKLSLFFRSSIPGKNRSSSKGKPAFTRAVLPVEKKPESSQINSSSSPKASHSSDDESTEDISTIADIDNVRKIGLPRTGGSSDKKSSAHEEAKTSAKALETDSNDEPSEMKSELPCNNGSLVKKLILPLGHTAKRDRKRKKKVNKGDDQKKSRSDKGKCILITAAQRGSKASASVAPETSRPRKKRSSVNKRISISVSKEDRGVRTLLIRGQHEFMKEAPNSSRGLNELGVEVDKTTREENAQEEAQQVDRILGCRVQSIDVMSSPHVQHIALATSPAHSEPRSQSPRLTGGSASPDLLILRSHDGISEDHSAGIKASDVEDNETLQAAGPQNITDRVDGDKIGEDDIGLDKVDMEKSFMDLNASKSEIREESALSTKDAGELAGKVETEEKADVPLNDAILETRQSATGKNETLDAVLKESVPTVKENVLYEFLVKWVGQSHIHNSWVAESHLKVLAKRKLENYKAKFGTAVINFCQEQWKTPQRVVSLRTSKSGKSEALVKWYGLSYDECTWESLEETVIERSEHLIAEFKKFERQTLDKDASGDNLPRTQGGQQNEVVPLIEQPEYLKGGLLFPHQLEALNWLRKCWHKSKNVILADEMGLGKTVSACAFISSLYFEFKARLPCLVLVPLSTMPNWLSEFSLWAPHLNVVEYHGSAKARSLIRQYEWHASDPSRPFKKMTSYKFNVLLTTYEMVLVDASHLRGVQWEVLVVDEGHRLKNSESKLFSMLNKISFQHRVLLTGTPLQNNIGEMYNLLNFLQPASFPSLSSFEEKFNDLTTAEKVEELKKLVAPHMLRRLKKDAMQNIPPKTERMVPVELSSIQAEYYRAMLTKNYQILRNIGKGVAQQSMLNIVMQLRKVCNHPYLIPGTEPESGSVEFLQEMRIKASAKLTLLHSMLKVLSKEGHRVLIFSQMTKLLDILEDYLTVEFGPKTFERVDGSVSVADRQAAIARFNQDKSRFVFLLSTRSCGLGINLATADTVIIYDSDFNPHADIQAMNRAHRIGQSKRLLVYRLVVRASVEERILQLAKKKLMLDQLFVNKSESQKDVEDILRWGTEELFSDSGVAGKDINENSSNKSEVTAETEQRHRKRGGGLGDVYKDRCTDGCTKIVWDENAILRLLDRSNLQSGPAESADGDLENDMLGSVKSVEWNDEPTEEQGGTELLPSMTSDVCAQSSEKKEDHTISSNEENEWDRLLRVRWEKYQSEEEAALGRGKRLRKAVSYREAFVPIPSEALIETCNEEEPEPELEPEYTPAGRALKAKYAKLRARQKERIAQRHIAEGPHFIEHQLEPKLPPQFSPMPTGEGESQHMIKPIEPIETLRDQAPVIDLEENKLNQSSAAPKKRSDSIMRLGRFSKHGYKSFQNSNLDLSVRLPGSLTPDMFLPSSQFQTSSYGDLASTSNNLLPVLGLCAPNASQVDSKPRNFRSYLNLPRSNCGQSKTDVGVPEFPLRLAPGAATLTDEHLKAPETTADTSMLPDTSLGALHHRLKSTIQDSSFPFSHVPYMWDPGYGDPDCGSGVLKVSQFPPITSQGTSSDPLDRSGDAFSAFQEKMALPKLVLDDKLPPKFSLPSKDVSKSHPDLVASLSLGMKREEAAKDSVQDLPMMPLLPNFRLQPNENPNQNLQARDLPPPMLGLGQMQATSSSFLPEKHKKVLENIIMRTGSGANSLLKKKLKVDAWSEDELDALWIGVRRHGRGNWECMLRDPKLKFSKYRTTEDLSERWEEEQLKILDGPAFPPRKSMKSTLFPGISDAMMTRALLGSRFTGLGPEHCTPPKFRSHLTDIQLGYGDLPSSLPHLEPTDHFGPKNDHISPIPRWKPDKFTPRFTGDFPAGPSDRAGDPNLPLDQPFLPKSLAGSSVDSPNLNRLSSCDLQQKEEHYASKYLKLPSLLDKSLNWLRDTQNNARSGESSSGIVPNPNTRPHSGHSRAKDDIAGSSTTNKLPHWLREAVSVPAKPSEPKLPPTVSAIAHSVRLLYGEEKSTIPPFTIPAPPPSQPKDPRRILKKKKRMSRKMRQLKPDIVASSRRFQSSLLGDNIALSSSIPPAPLFPLLPPSTSGTLGFPWIEPNLSLSSLNQNMMNSPSSSSFLNPRKKGMMMSPSPEVLNLVASCVAPGPSMPSSSFPRTELPVTKPYEPFEPIGMVGSPDMKGLRGKRKARRGSLLGSWGPLPEERVDRVDSGDSSKTQSDPFPIDRPEIEEISSEETVSDDRRSEN
ncbi:protein CHROMATIN REMODELING 4 isoform X2 [Magnolia sinica]|uniref:protein CHROMATIN REMODELING 4 isoform X2 n=1 Tax=Magnolia sinica TaxID=86752 RepID=UPI0026589D38|nr:protein CHROMATIN REMODELING 4 isoform X2 [Magnolia sinica]